MLIVAFFGIWSKFKFQCMLSGLHLQVSFFVSRLFFNFYYNFTAVLSLRFYSENLLHVLFEHCSRIKMPASSQVNNCDTLKRIIEWNWQFYLFWLIAKLKYLFHSSTFPLFFGSCRCMSQQTVDHSYFPLDYYF